MENILSRLRLITPFVLNFPISKDNLIKRLQPHVAPTDLNPFGRLGKIFNPTIAPYTGTIEPDSFRLKPRTENIFGSATIKGQLISTESGTQLEGEIHGASGIFIFFSLFYLIFSCMSLLAIVKQIIMGEFAGAIFFLFFSLIQGLFFIGLPYRKIRINMQNTAHNLERDIHYFIQAEK